MPASTESASNRTSGTATMNIGAIGIDSSHLPEFTRRISEMHQAGDTPCRVTHYWTDGRHDWPNPDDVQGWKAKAEELGAEQADSLDDMLDRVDGVMVLAVSGFRHLELATPALERGMPTYIDKPLTCDLDQARRVLALSNKHNAPCYSASSLRFATELDAIPRDTLGDLVAIDAYGPGELNDGAPGLLHYGVHTIEMIDAIWGPGVKRVSAIETPDRHLVDLDYGDRYARLRLERKGAYDFGATLSGTKGTHSFKVDFGPVYSRLVRGMTRFFEGGEPPARLEHIVENIAVMLAGNESIAKQGEWVQVP
ncbi:MAG: Gfo/Idh/MocA family protein [Phycisphaerales bacterium JB040]